MTSSASKVASRFAARQIAFRAAADLRGGVRTASSREITGETLAAFVDAFWVPTSLNSRQARVSLRSLGKKVKQLGSLFKKAPRLWEDFKRLIGVKSITELPRALKDLAKRGYSALKKIMGRAFEGFPLKMFLIKGTGVNDFLKKIMGSVPGLDRVLGQIKARGDVLGDWLRKNLPKVSTVVIVAIFIFIWMNVVEFEWNLSDLSKALIGQISLGDLLASLPGSALGFLMNGLGFGTFTLLPYAVVARMMWLISKGYVQWDGRGFVIDDEALRRDGYGVSSFV
jgi:hypothetical protein